MEFWRKGQITSLLLPPGVVLLAAVLLLNGNWVPLPAALVAFYFYAVFITGILLAWRFHSSRVFLLLLVLLLSERALEFFSSTAPATTGPGRIAFEVISLLLPLNFLFFSLAAERGLALPTVIPRLLAIFVQAVFVAVLCRPDQRSPFSMFHHPLLNSQWFKWTDIPQVSLLAFTVAATFLLLRFLEHRKPVESGLFWAVISAFLAFQSGAAGRISQAYIATAALVLLIAIVETSYSMAYHDELTGLPGRRAFNEALLALAQPYCIAIVDIDHFKQFNDTYGHDTGDQVLRLVASKLAQITGGGKSYRCGGEEFAILFPAVSVPEATPHLELVRQSIETTAFRLRAGERRFSPRKTDRRKVQVRKGRLSRTSPRAPARGRRPISVTVSIGVAEPTTKLHETDQVIDAADKALYRAKANGRNRLEIAGSSA